MIEGTTSPPDMFTSLRSFLRFAGVNRAVSLGLLAKFWSVAAGSVTILLIASYFSSDVQGYYYTFSSLLALQVLVELGFGQVIMQFVSHEWARLSVSREGRITGDPEALSRVGSIARIAFRWYLGGALVAAPGLGLAGYLFFVRSADHGIPWQMPWLVLCGLTGIRLAFTPLWSLLEGSNQLTELYTYRFVEGLLMSVSVWIAIVLGADLWALSLSALVSILLTAVFITSKYRHFFGSLLTVSSSAPIDWRSEMWPLQWRIAISFISGYFIFSLFVPIVFHYHGATEAGRVGMTWNIAAILTSIGGTWVAVVAPRFGVLIAAKNYAELDRLLVRVSVASSVVGGVAIACVWAAVVFLNSIGHPLANRLLTPIPTGFFLLGAFLMLLTYPYSTYLRAHKKEPLLGTSIASAILIALTTWTTSKYSSVTAVALGYLLVSLIILPIVGLIWKRRRAEWHA